MARCVQRGALARFEAKGRAYHQRVREGFRLLARLEPERFAVIDASGDEGAVAAAILRAVDERLEAP